MSRTASPIRLRDPQGGRMDTPTIMVPSMGRLTMYVCSVQLVPPGKSVPQPHPSNHTSLHLASESSSYQAWEEGPCTVVLCSHNHHRHPLLRALPEESQVRAQPIPSSVPHTLISGPKVGIL